MKSTEKMRLIGLICLATPFLAMAFMVASNQYGLRGTEYRFEITGFDPRDILKGHYLTFRYVWPGQEETEERCIGGVDCCVCASGDPKAPDVTVEACATMQRSCPAMLRFKPHWGDQPPEALRQYYIPEEYAPVLDEKLRMGIRKFEVGLVIQRNGAGRLKMLYIDGEPLPVFLKSLKPIR